MTQKQQVIGRLDSTKSVSNFWAIENYILRLGAIIHDLKAEGWEFRGEFGTGKEKKNFYYHVTKRPLGPVGTCCYSFGKFGSHHQQCPTYIKTAPTGLF